MVVTAGIVCTQGFEKTFYVGDSQYIGLQINIRVQSCSLNVLVRVKVKLLQKISQGLPNVSVFQHASALTMAHKIQQQQELEIKGLKTILVLTGRPAHTHRIERLWVDLGTQVIYLRDIFYDLESNFDLRNKLVCSSVFVL